MPPDSQRSLVGHSTRPSTVAYGLHTLFNSTTHGVYGKGWSDACLFVAEKLREQERLAAQVQKHGPPHVYGGCGCTGCTRCEPVVTEGPK